MLITRIKIAVLMLISPVSAFADAVAFDTFGPGDSFATGPYGVDGNAQFQAFQFVAAESGNLSVITVAIGRNSVLTTHTRFQLYTDDGDSLGVLLETIDVPNNVAPTPVQPFTGEVVASASVAKPMLNAGETYWLSYSEPNLADGQSSLWFFNDQGFAGLRLTSALGPIGGGLPAFRIEVAEIPDSGDADGDGIEDGIDGVLNGVFDDQSLVFSDDFTDQHLGGSTHGIIVDRSDNEVTVVDDLPDGVVLAANGGVGTSLVQMCGPFNTDIFNVLLVDSNEIAVKCGSLTGEVLSGPVTITVGVNVNITIPSSAKAFLEQLPGSLVAITNLSEAGGPHIVVEDDSGVTNLGPGDPPLVTIVDDGITDAPDDVFGRAKSGKVNLLWTVVDADSYDVFRSSQSSGPYDFVGSVGNNVYVDNDVVNGETYYYVVRAIAGGNSSANSNEAEVQVPLERVRR